MADVQTDNDYSVVKPGDSAKWLRIGAVSAALSVILGAIAAHYLDRPLLDRYGDSTHVVMGQTIPSAVKYLNDFKTAAEYHMYHSLALIAVGIIACERPSRSLNVAGWFFLIGIVLFSGSLYTLVLTGQRWLGAITPLGGLSFIIGWLTLASSRMICRLGRNR